MKLLFLWHLHQPMYKDYASGRYWLPWVYLHTTKDYFEMARIVAAFPRLRVTFNLVPSLLESINDYAEGQARDAFLELYLKPPESMERGEKEFLLENFFHLNPHRIHSHERYRDLYIKKMERRSWSEGDLRDLQVLFHLAWLGESVRRQDAEIARLVEKGRNYTEADKQRIYDKMTGIFRSTIPLYRSLWEDGRIEVSTTPYYHPILPLLCDAGVARLSDPGVKLDDVTFRHPEDARQQLDHALATCEAILGRRPVGIWPAEGAVSDAALAILRQQGVVWAASDSAVLERSLPPGASRSGAHFKPYLYAGGERPLTLFFRDHGLSDLIGFVYGHWREDEAVEDFIGKLRAIEQAYPWAVVTVILDGENPWEHYPANGYDFLTALYRRVEQEPWIEALTFSQALHQTSERGRLTHIHPGSWIAANFNTWIGDPEKNTAWLYLERARRVMEDVGAGPAPDVELARRSLWAAEGSDWFWWFGEPHHSPHDPVFDWLFRTHLRNIYSGMGVDAPSYLDVPVGIHMGALVRTPVAFMHPIIDGRDTHYFEWQPAGLLNLQSRGPMAPSSALLARLYFGCDEQNLFIRVDFQEKASKVLADARLRIEIYSVHGGITREVEAPTRTADAAVGDIVEVKIALADAGLSFGDSFDLMLVVSRNGELERYPPSGVVRLTLPDRDFDSENWCV